ncbi:MAG: hypothetical protein DHS20C05_25880 [Hyphococcus sp.]|nr:MAG: hypothetical protein DHS20C05_25880 [Marinicaulis sp.]
MRALFIFVLFLTGCTSYNAGVESNWARHNVLLVNGSGNALSSDGRIEDYVFLKAAEKALEAGYRYYVVTESINTGGRETFTTYSPYTTTISGSTSGRFIGNSYYGTTNATATTTGGPKSYTYYFPGREAVFVMYDTKPQNYRPSQYYDAVKVYNDLGPKYLSNFDPISAQQITEASPQSIKKTPAIKEAVTTTSVNFGQAVAPSPLREPKSNIRREKTLDEIYDTLSDDEKFTADNLSGPERVQYLYNRR